MRGIRIPEVKRARALRRAATSAERKVWAGLRNRALGGHKFVRQERIGPYYADFACREARLVVEIDGATHSTERELAYDKAREDFLRAQGYRIVRFTNGEVYEQADSVFDAILAALRKAPRERGPASVLLRPAPHLTSPRQRAGRGAAAFVPDLEHMCMP